jgi:hypothetical protein
LVQQLILGRLIALHICSELVAPECAIGGGHIRKAATGMPVPEASMDEDHHAMFWKHDVWPARQARAVQSVPETVAVQKTA